MKTKKKQTFFKPNVPSKIKNLSWPQAKSRFPLIKPYGDADRDGLKNYKDCKPFDIKRQGKEHDEEDKEFEEMENSKNKQIPLGRSMLDYSAYRSRKKLKEWEERNEGI